MAALVRCAARRLGGSLLQRTQAAEPRQLFLPSRLMHNSEEHARADFAREIQQKKKEMYDAISKWEKDSMTTGAAQHLSIQVTPRPHDSHLCAPVSCQSNNAQIQDARSKPEQKNKQELYDAISKAKKMILSCTYNMRGSNNSRLAWFARGFIDVVKMAFAIIVLTLCIGRMLAEITFILYMIAVLVALIQVAYKMRSENKIKN